MKILPYQTHQLRGSAMITTMLILTTIMLGFMLSGLFSSVREKESFAENDRMAVAEQAANACAEIAINRLGRDSASYVGNEDILIDTNITCRIRPIIVSTTWTIETTATVDGRVANYRIVLNAISPVDISSWKKVQNF
jgi:hypothetical protein